jgi:hypothetical protein
VFAATVNATLPGPVPAAPLEIAAHGAALVAVQLQPVVVVTATAPPPVALVNDWLIGVIVNTQGAAACVTVNVAPAIVRVPTRLTVAVFAATLKVTVAVPRPVAPAVTVIQGALLTAVHAQPTPAVTVLLPVPADDVSNRLTGEIDGAHGALNAKVLDRTPALLPPGPIDSTRAS